MSESKPIMIDEVNRLRKMGYTDMEIFECVQKLLDSGELWFCDQCLIIYSPDEGHECKEEE